MAWDDTKVTSGTLTAAEWNAMVTDQKTRIVTIIEDTTPQLGGNLDIQAFNIETAVAADFVKLAGITSTVTELNYTDGVTSSIQTQINGKESTLTKGNLTEATSSVLTITGGTNSIIGSGLTIEVDQADTSNDGYLSSTDWDTFNGKQNTITTNNLTEATSSVLTITNGTNAIIGGSALTIEVDQADTSNDGYLSSTDWDTFNGKGDMNDLSDDTTPQLGGDLDLNEFALTRIETAGESLVAGNLCYLKSDGKYWKADASVDTTCSQDLLMCDATISADATGKFVEFGEWTTTGLTAGSIYYVSETGGAITTTAPTTSTSIVRIVGTALSTTVLKFKPDESYVEVA